MIQEALHAYQRPETDQKQQLLGRQSVGLQARLLTGDFTMPLLLTRASVDHIRQNGAAGIDHDVAERYEAASLTQRRRYQQETGLTLSEWKKKFNSYLQTVRDDRIHAERNTFLELIGISRDVTADNFYDEYLRGGSQVMKFVGDIESVASREQIERHADIIRNLGNSFGHDTSRTIEHLIHGVRNVVDNPDEFIETVSGAANVPRTLHNPLLRVITHDSEQTEQTLGQENQVRRTEPPSQPAQEFQPSSTIFGSDQPLLDDAVRLHPNHQTEERTHDPEPPPEKSPRHLRETTTPIERVFFEEDQDPGVIREKAERRDEGNDPSGTADTTAGNSRFVPLTEFPPTPSKPLPPLPQPAPFQEDEEKDQDPLTEEESRLAMRYLSYSDINPPPYESPSDLLAKSGLAKEYIREFVAMTKDYGRPLVLEAAIDAGQYVGELLDGIGLERSPASRSPSWYLWHAAMSRFLANNPDVRDSLRDADRYHPFDPFLHTKRGATREQIIQSKKANDEIIDRMFGWEIYRQRGDRRMIFRHMDPNISDKWDRLHQLLDEEPKEDGTDTISSYKLIEIGRIVRTSV